MRSWSILNTSTRHNRVYSPYGYPWTTGDVIGCLLDLDNDTMEFTWNGVSQGIAFSHFKMSGNSSAVTMVTCV